MTLALYRMFFPTCQVRVVRFYVSCLLLLAGPQPRSSTPSVPCRTSTTTIHAKCSLPDLNHDHPRPVFPAGPQPRPSTPSVPCWTPQPRVSTPSVPCRTSTTSIHAKCSLPDFMTCPECQIECQIECQNICRNECQIECQIECQNICQNICQIDC